MKILNVVGARPNFMKIAPLIRDMNARKDRIEHLLVHTGQHYDKSMSDDFFVQLGIPQPDVNLGIGSASHAQQTAKILTAFESVLVEHNPDMVVVVGDVNSTMACALVAAKSGVKVAHVEAGLRSFDRTMPEEINRILTDALSDLLFTTEEAGNENLRREGIPQEKIFFVGNVMIDTLVHCLAAMPPGPPHPGLEKKEYAVITLHRPSNVDHPETLKGMLRAFQDISKNLKLVIPLHPRTRANIERFGLSDALRALEENAVVTGPAGYVDMLRLVKDSRMVITDSGGIQEETTYLGVPCITLRANTERPSTVTLGTNTLVGSDTGKLLRAVERVMLDSHARGTIPPLWDGHASERIVEHLLRSAAV
ncbi:MAG TPA: UDP-N-acetylglucosamine 2-epimerase (non-hydrolyzing) [Deltaproteobacteria bacterium]|jgi:UDP-N-acetylglucosamine 2-epimerase (non-hydrolysing)|nr:UDP-N-acetylglucosamine 2-epimerase (non-hydrolyzing) [Deltaproteobacteria bacterium]HRR22387.1 UDP-N-acetylglucosamine 2-epimerase (non-hydrolyzing) [Desulfomonilia bacterium]HOD72642.1 UDP-N-acetylglucosamine 2-epimerase (non-hydrolyzing) [Deltaproteobacteria bacterium]HPX51607.1 UDP-N-acetylglucosamine 2-epimerase (non-hydrolyzing) [Deltaproteobacteria bacterium]HQA72857.1 UDP-N-acetylglucosamine 2-epimerase (non-hydrolyzing) [Deltaproteobacteria bacterium]